MYKERVTTLKRIIKRVVKKTAPRLTYELRRLKRIEDKLDLVEATINLFKMSPHHDNRLDILRNMATKVEPYQPPYGIAGIFDNPARGSIDRARVIEQRLGMPAGQRILDIGSSLGYMCYYFADRGAITEGWEARIENAEFSRMVGELNGVNTHIKTKLFDAESVKTIRTGEYDVVFILSVLHHITHYQGLEYTQLLMKELLERVPMVVVELARRGEDRKLFWNAAQPKDELAIFELVKDDIIIEKIGDFPNHLSKRTRPLYVIRSKQTITVNNRSYRYDRKSYSAYSESPMVYSSLLRRYYLGDDFIVKEYDLTKDTDQENQRQIVADVSNLLQLKNVYGIPKLIEYELTPYEARIVIERIPGDLLLDVIEQKREIDVLAVAAQVLRTISDLQKQNLNHNDIRSWNILASKKKFSVIDYGLTGITKKDDDIISLLWVLHSILSGQREGYEHFKQLPDAALFIDPVLKKLYQAVKQGERSADKLAELL